MHARFSVIAAAALTVTTVAVAQPAKAPPPAAAHAPGHPKPVVLASADRLPGAEGAPQASPAPAKRHARVTSCRCGDPQPQADEQEQP